MKYYKKGGFFDRLESLNRWIDIRVSRLKCALFEGDNYDRWYFTRIKRFDYLDDIEDCMHTCYEPVENLKTGSIDFDLISLKRKHYREYVNLYNREKYWWMEKIKG